MNEDVERIEGNLRLRIEVDMDGSCSDPKEYMPTSVVTPYGSGTRRYTIDDRGATFQREHDELYERGLGHAFGRYMKIFHGITALPVYMYEHSSVALSAVSFVGRAQHAEWDSGMIGWAYIDPEKVEEYGIRDVEDAIKSDVETLGQWINGEVYGWIIEECVTGRKVYDNGSSEDPFKEWVEVESCWGYIGYENTITVGVEEFDHQLESRKLEA